MTYRTAAYATTKSAQVTIMESLYGQLKAAYSDLHTGVVLPPMTRTNLAYDDLSYWERVESSLAKAGRPPPSSSPNSSRK